MKRSEIEVGARYAVTDGVARYQRIHSKAVQVEVLEIGVRRGYYHRTSDWHGQEAEKQDGIRVRFLERAEEFGKSYGNATMPYENGSCAKDGVGVIQARDFWMPWSDLVEVRDSTKREKETLEAKVADQRSRANRVIETFGGGVPRIGEGVVGVPKVELPLEVAEEVAAIVEAARALREQVPGDSGFSSALIVLHAALDAEVPVALGDEEGEPLT